MIQFNDIKFIPWVIFHITVILSIASCSPVTMVKPLEKNQWAAGASIGGPLIGLGDLTIPVPFTTISGAYGVDTNTTFTAKIYPTSALFGVAQLDVGMLHRFRDSHKLKPGISALPQAMYMIDRWEGRSSFYPSLDINAWWNANTRGDFFYIGATYWFELRKRGALGREQKQHWIPALNAGYTLIKKKWNTTFEFKYLAPGNSNQNLVVDYKAPGQNGATALFISFTRIF